MKASASPHVVPAPWSDPAGVDPEEAFVASLSSCHMLFFLDLASRTRGRASVLQRIARARCARNEFRFPIEMRVMQWLRPAQKLS